MWSIFQKTFLGVKWSLTDIADHTQLGSPARLATKRRMIQSSSSQGNMGDTVRRLEQQLQESQIKEEQLQKRAEEQQKQAEEQQRQAEEQQRQAKEQQRQAEEQQRQAEEQQRQTEEQQRQAEEQQRQAEEQQRQAEEQLRQAEEQQRQAEARVEALQRQVADSNTRAENSQRRGDDLQRRAAELQRQIVDSNGRANTSSGRADEFQRRAESAESRVHQLERSLAETTQGLRQSEDRYQISSTHWAVRREEIELTGPQLGVGGWATVTVAKFRGAEVAVKRIHNQIVSRHNIQLFQREMNIAARLRHPNLIQFIGATMEGEMMIIMELMATSLRSQLETEEYFQPKLVKAISLDVALGLNYLHLIQPDPIVHRDISTTNVLLEKLSDGKWRAKLTDYGSVNVVRQLRTKNPGSPAYAAPEASNPRLQSPKMDIYSFGALILEMLTGRLPTPEDRPGMFRKVQHEQLLHLIRRCLSENPEGRPSASGIISELCS